MVSQFVSPEKVTLLGGLNFSFPEGTHAIGRLDARSEGLLLLTTNKKITRLLFQGNVPHKRTYLVRVNGIMTPETAHRLSLGIDIVADGGAIYKTMPCAVEILETAPDFLEPFQLDQRPLAPHSWIQMTLVEGKFHQVRKMVKATRYPCRRLIRTAIEDMTIEGMKPGDVKEMDEDTFFRSLKLPDSN